MSEPSFNRTEPFTELTVLEASQIPTAVVEARNVPMEDLPALFDRTFSGLFPALAEAEKESAAPAFALYTRQPSDTVDLEVGLPLTSGLSRALPLGEGLIAIPSQLPGGSIAARSHLGGYDGLAEAWAAFLNEVVAAGHHPGLPFFEVYVTDPNPDMDPADLRTDLFLTLS
ncbi:MAG: GyrI-like domain-containing protein [Brevibacterium sp.]|uniref:GyrI-like domain-containing protein n=1 Tax=Brevibacterium sp. TaxID=1701 RepID=UPI002649AE99|nr:GyrI-like domain-containing protein [Brevibacterium sp.]MDN5807434.1 GyrI-like domain-containing protein [Brevibacterium sp.]MDN5834503.1 GyrI-like domain-containing protein [Brevibacterium sp.]MDN5876586.1 GyrI-like domain-containing protein [Brevibacterium sp.]MDN5908926.1 GyrI-like domain-containing protein [Brevibacterium sp.]MDN6133900.1 GyrI-like domain-containing protein [Brevibacterium sp.]